MYKYTVDYNTFQEGGAAEFYNLKENKSLGFKQFRNKKMASVAYSNQKLLSKYGLAPKVIGNICQLPYILYNGTGWVEKTNWGFITIKARIVLDANIMKKRLKQIQDLVDKIYKKTGLKFWDCHYWNIGYIKDRLVCIDTGKESFQPYCNAWGFAEPGPRCCYCNKYQCRCEE